MKLQLFDALALGAALAAAARLPRCRPRDFLPLVYPALLLASLLASHHPALGRGAWCRTLYLAGLACSVSILIQAEPDRARSALRRGWIGGWLLVVAGLILGLAGFLAGYDSPERSWFLFQHGSLSAAHYPRLCSTFLNANMLCNYLIVTLGWLRSPRMQVALLASAVPTLSPGLGPLLLTFFGLRSSRLGKIFAVVTTVGFFLFTWVYPLEALHGHFKPSGRFECWRQASEKWLDEPVLGQGPGQAKVAVQWTEPTGGLGFLTDPHNAVLDVLSQGGLVALLGIAFVTLRRPAEGDRRLAFALMVALWVDGLTGSFDDTRHLWLGLGVLEAGRHQASLPGGLFRKEGSPPEDEGSVRLGEAAFDDLGTKER